MPVTTTVRMNARWARKNTITGTAIVSSADAWIRVGWLAYSALYCWIPIESGCSSGLLARYSSGTKKSFHAKKKWNSATAVIAAIDWGTMTERRIRNGPAPSIIAASSRSRGIDMKYCRSRKTLKALAKKWGTIRGSQVPFQPSQVKITYVGRRVTWNGRMIVAMRTTNRTFRPGKRNRAKPYATSTDESTAPIVLSTAIAIVLKNSRGKFSCDQTVEKFSSRGEKPHA